MNFEIGQIFENQYPPEAALWCNERGDCHIERIAFDDKRAYQIVATPEPSLDDLKVEKLNQLAKAHLDAEANAHILSSVGFEIDANDRANRDINGLLVTMGEEDVVTFCDYNNVMHEVTYTQLKQMLLELIQNAQYIYAQKWMMRDAINSAESKEELDAVEIKFEYIVSYADANVDDTVEEEEPKTE